MGLFTGWVTYNLTTITAGISTFNNNQIASLHFYYCGYGVVWVIFPFFLLGGVICFFFSFPVAWRLAWPVKVCVYARSSMPGLGGDWWTVTLLRCPSNTWKGDGAGRTAARGKSHMHLLCQPATWAPGCTSATSAMSTTLADHPNYPSFLHIFLRLFEFVMFYCIVLIFCL